MFNFVKLAVGTAIAPIIPMSQAAARPLTLLTVPDCVRRMVQAVALNRIVEGATPGVDASFAIHRNFSQVIEQNFARLSEAEATALLDNLSERGPRRCNTDLASRIGWDSTPFFLDAPLNHAS